MINMNKLLLLPVALLATTGEINDNYSIVTSDYSENKEDLSL